MSLRRVMLGTALGTLLLAGAAQAAPITYIFTGDGTGTLDGNAFTSFTVTVIGDPTKVTSSGGELFNNVTGSVTIDGGVTDTFTGDIDEVILNPDPATPRMGFGQIVFSPFNVAVEAIQNPVFTNYDLAKAFPLTTGLLEAGAATYLTTNGSFDVDSVSSLSFQATGGVPEPATWAMMLVGFGGLGAAMRTSRRAKAAAAIA